MSLITFVFKPKRKWLAETQSGLKLENIQLRHMHKIEAYKKTKI